MNAVTQGFESVRKGDRETGGEGEMHQDTGEFTSLSLPVPLSPLHWFFFLRPCACALIPIR